MYSDQFIVEVKAEIARLEEVKGLYEARIDSLRLMIADKPPEGHPGPVKRAYKKRGRPRAIDIDLQSDGNGFKSARGLSLAQLQAMDTSKMGTLQLRKHEKAIANKKYRAQMNEAKSPGTPGKRKYTKRQMSPGKNAPINRFSLEREFDLGDKDISLIISYLISWKATGRLQGTENLALDSIQGIAKGNLSDVQKSNLREAFYSARGRIMDRARSTSDV